MLWFQATPNCPPTSDQYFTLGALGLIVNAITVWNTKYLQAVLEWLKVIGEVPNPEDLAHLYPLRYEHIHMRPGPEGGQAR